MADLRRLLAGLGARDAETYLQSGNAVLASALEAEELERAVAEALAAELGLAVEVLVRTGGELAELVRRNPFADDPAKLHVTFLKTAPEPGRVAALPAEVGPDRLHAAGREVYLHVPEGYGRSKLSNAYFERTLGVAATTRNWRTVSALAERAS